MLVCLVELPLEYRATNNGRSSHNVRSELGILGHLFRFFTDLFREILIFNYLIIRKKKKANVKLNNQEIQEIPGGRKFLRRRPVLTANHRVFVILFTKCSQLVLLLARYRHCLK